ncbi:cytochrome b/b6 domain-containing protein [Vibrio sp. ZSDZ34]|jgi:thiosulfate reductase cytochrome b subunit|uniref:Cytochrome b/b6 domain-containing protein n=1 Tax=Vibrio gelatinilyticus TaxID=2893468 RepID=A0A9X1WIN4_9VIBR|nr:cytochrome b/b6 domain-containing protein [Vibrio gelatinilyticus]MCJ2377384.1 cytochrome b/b6 domain-containing protein [Vibrio gelatinilyticus]
MKKSVVIFKRFERLWHWTQALLVLALIVTGLELHDIIHIVGFKQSSNLHHWAGFIWVVVVVLILTWILTTGEWKQFKPSTIGVDRTLRFYLYGIFVGEPHSHHMSAQSKFNPLQRLAYLGLLFVLVPLQILTGLVFFFFPELREAGVIEQIGGIATLHTLIAYIMISFLIVHLYLITLGEKLSSHLKAMVTGKDHSQGTND